MSGYTKKNLKEDVENSAPKFDMPEEMEARFARRALEGETLGLSHIKLAPELPHPVRAQARRTGRGLRRRQGLARGSRSRTRSSSCGQWDAIRFGKDTMRNVEAGPDGVEYIAFGAGDDPRDAEMAPGWWTD